MLMLAAEECGGTCDFDIYGSMSHHRYTCVRLTHSHATHRIYAEDCALIEALGAAMVFELVVGLNGYFWVRTQRPEHAIALRAAILNAETLSDEDAVAGVSQILQTIKRKSSSW